MGLSARRVRRPSGMIIPGWRSKTAARALLHRNATGDTARSAGTIIVGLIAAGCFLAAVIDTPPHLLAATVSAVLGALSVYVFMLQHECRGLASWHDRLLQQG